MKPLSYTYCGNCRHFNNYTCARTNAEVEHGDFCEHWESCPDAAPAAPVSFIPNSAFRIPNSELSSRPPRSPYTEIVDMQARILERDGYHFASGLLRYPDLHAEFEYLLSFAREIESFTDTPCQQLRALWTAYCFHANLDVDTCEYDRKLHILWNAMIPQRIDRAKTGIWEKYEHFDQYMSAHLV